MGMPAATPMHSARAWSEARGLPKSKSSRDMRAFSYNSEELTKANFRAALRKTNLYAQFGSESGAGLAGFLEGAISLFVTKSNDGIDAHGAPGRKVASDHGDRGEQQSYSSQCNWVDRAHAKKQACQETRGAVRRQDSEQFAGQREFRRLQNNEAQNVQALGAKSDANTHLAGSPGDSIRNDAINAGRGKRQCNQGKKAKQNNVETSAGKRLRKNLAHGLNL